MALIADGTGQLDYPNKIVSAYPYSVMVWASRDGGSGDQWWAAQGQTTGDRFNGLYAQGGASSVVAIVRNPGLGDIATLTTTINSTMRLAIVTYTSEDSFTVYYGSNVGQHTNTALTNDLASHDICVLGGYHFNGANSNGGFTGKIAENHWFSTALTVPQIDALLADTVKPEDTPGWIDGWTFKDYNAGGTYTSIGGSRTMTATGGIAATGVAHPIDRSGPPVNLTGANLSQSSTISTGAVTVTPPSSGTVNLVGANLTQSATISTGAVSVTSGSGGATITHRPLARNTHSGTATQLWANETGLTIRYYSLTTGALVTSKTGWTTNSAGVPPAVTDALLVAGTTYDIRYILSGGARGSDILAAA